MSTKLLEKDLLDEGVDKAKRWMNIYFFKDGRSYPASRKYLLAQTKQNYIHPSAEVSRAYADNFINVYSKQQAETTVTLVFDGWDMQKVSDFAYHIQMPLKD